MRQDLPAVGLLGRCVCLREEAALHGEFLGGEQGLRCWNNLLSHPGMEKHIEEDEVRSSADLRIRKSQVRFLA